MYNPVYCYTWVVVVIFDKPGDNFEFYPSNLTHFSENCHKIFPGSSFVSQDIQSRQLLIAEGLVEPEDISVNQILVEKKI